MEVSRTASRRLRAVFTYAPTAARWLGLPPAASHLAMWKERQAGELAKIGVKQTGKTPV